MAAGTANYISKWTDGDTIGNSLIQDNGTTVSVGGAGHASYKFHVVSGKARFDGTIVADVAETDTVSYAQMIASPLHFWGAYCAFRQATNHSLNLDVYNGGTVKVGWTILQDGSFGIGSGSVTGSSGGRLYFKSPSNVNGEQVGRIEWWNENGAGIMAKISCVRETSALAPAGLGFYTSANVDSTDNSGEGAWSQKMIINSAGKVGIGTTAPARKLEVYGDTSNWCANFRCPTDGYGVTIGNRLAAGTGYAAHLYWSGGDAGSFTIQPYSYTNSSSRGLVLCPSDGNVGIGTTAPAEILTLDSSSNTRLLLREAGGNKGQIAAGGGGLYIQNLAGDVIFRNISDADTVRIKNDGKVGIGTTAPGDHLSIEGSGNQVLSIYSTTTGVQSNARTFLKLYGEYFP